jgi:hypothetical protein
MSLLVLLLASYETDVENGVAAFNLLKPTGYGMHQQLCALPTLYSYGLYLS